MCVWLPQANLKVYKLYWVFKFNTINQITIIRRYTSEVQVSKLECKILQ